MQVPMQWGSEKGTCAPISLPQVSQEATRYEVTWEFLAVVGTVVLIRVCLEQEASSRMEWPSCVKTIVSYWSSLNDVQIFYRLSNCQLVLDVVGSSPEEINCL